MNRLINALSLLPGEKENAYWVIIWQEVGCIIFRNRVRRYNYSIVATSPFTGFLILISVLNGS